MLNIISVFSFEGRFVIGYTERNLILYSIVFKQELWDKYIVKKKLHIVSDNEEYEMDEFFNECDMIAQELAKQWLQKRMS